jgi:hypothetical protein
MIHAARILRYGVFLALACALMVAAGCGSTSHGPSSVEQAFAKDMNVPISDARCVADGAWIETYPVKETRQLSWCYSVRKRDMDDGCYDTDTGADLTIAVRGSEPRGAHKCMGNSIAQFRERQPLAIRDDFDIERALERITRVSLDQGGATCEENKTRVYSCSLLAGNTERGFRVACAGRIRAGEPFYTYGQGCRYRRMTVAEEADFGIENARADAYRKKLAQRPATPTPSGQTAEAIAARLRASGHSNVMVKNSADGRFTVLFDEGGYRFLVEKSASPASARESAAFWGKTLQAERTRAIGPLFYAGFTLGSGAQRPAPASTFNRFVSDARGG